MQIISLDTLKSISGYTDTRSVRTWLSGLGVPLLKIGKQHCADNEMFEKAMEKKYRITKRRNGYQPKQQTEIDFLSDLTRCLSEL